MRTWLVILVFSVGLGTSRAADDQATVYFEAEGHVCGHCNGGGKETCSVCKGEDLTKRVCWNCKGQDLTLKTCWNCKGEDLTKKSCWNCKGEDLTKNPCSFCQATGRLNGSRCYYCSGSGKQPRCVYCHGTGKESRCVYCHGTGKESRCVYCHGTGKESRCVYCAGKAASGAICKTCNGLGMVEVLVAKYSTLDDFRKSLAAKSTGSPRAPPTYQENASKDLLAAQDGSTYGEISKETGRPKTVFVRGYTRKDGTFVQSHYRSLPSGITAREPVLTFQPGVAENGSYYGEPNQYGIPKTVSVGGYYRKDGTYVRGHYRSAPRR